MKYKDIKVLDIEPVIYLGESFKKDWKSNQSYVCKKINEVKEKFEGQWGIECPIDDMVYIYLPYRDAGNNEDPEEVKVDIRYLLDAYKILAEIFDDVKISFYLDKSIEGIGNAFDMSIDEFNEYLKGLTNEIHVYKMNDYEHYASRWDIKETNEWYKKEWGVTEEDNPIDDIYEVDLDLNGVWTITENKKDIKLIGDLYERRIREGKTTIGDLIRMQGEVWKFISFRDAALEDLDFIEPYCIAASEC